MGWVLAEDHLPGTQVGELITVGLAEQFRRTRDGDRLWFIRDSDLSSDDLNWLDSVRLSDVIRMNTSITNIQDNVFFMPVPEPSTISLFAVSLTVAALACGYRRRQKLASNSLARSASSDT